MASGPPKRNARKREANTPAELQRAEGGALPRLPFAPEEFRLHLGRWFRAHARDLPWRGVHDPYATWLSEIMLQQTRVATVIERYREFLIRFPSLRALAEAEESDVLALWSGLGYYRRARMLHRGAQFVVRELDGNLPRTSAELRALPGIGDYTAAAVASIAFGEGIAVVDGNVERVLLRVLGLPEDRSGKARSLLAGVAQTLVPGTKAAAARSNPPGDHNQAMMELGATLCLPRSPLCLQCPVVDFCKTRGEHRTAPRGKPQSRRVAHLLALRKRGVSTEVLLERRGADLSLMPGMLELPPLPLDAIEHREPVLRLRHSITTTNYYVEIYAEGAAGVQPHRLLDDSADSDEAEPAVSGGAAFGHVSPVPLDVAVGQVGAAKSLPERFADLLGEVVEVPEGETVSVVGGEPSPDRLLASVPAAVSDLAWYPISGLYGLPLTGLTRKSLQRLRVMTVRRARLD